MTTAIAGLALLFLVLLGALAILQLLLILGLPLGRFAWGGGEVRLAGRRRVAAGVAILIYAVFVGIALARAHVITTPAHALYIGIAMWVVTASLFLSVLPNLASKSVYEKRAMTPVSAVLATLALLIALS